MTVAARPVVRNRLVVQIHGYQLTAPERFHRAFARDLATFGATWSLATSCEPPRLSERHATWQATTSGPGWQTNTDYRLIRLDDVIAERHARPLRTRLGQGLAGLSDFVFDRAIVGYFRYGWRYALFALAPLAMIALALVAGAASAWLLAGSIGLFLAVLAGIAICAGIVALAGRRWYLFTLLEDWAFASILARRLEPTIALRLDESAAEIRAALAKTKYDEVLLIGHSLGAALILHLAESILPDAPADRAPRLALLTIGSSVLKIALHSRAEPIRRATKAVTDSDRIVWAEYHAPQDIMNFPRIDPAKAMGVEARHPPIFRKAVFRQTLDAEGFKRMNATYFRRHNQFYHAGTRRGAYEYFVFVCGPFPAAALFREPEGATGWLDEGGALTPQAPVEPGPAAQRLTPT